jgi:hypothetical protein
MANRKRSRSSRVLAGSMAARVLDARVPMRWVNTLIGLFLLPLAGVWTQTFFTCFSRAAINHAFWATEEFWFFGLGGLLWVIAFFGLPRPVMMYVLGHELTHAVWVWMMGGRVSRMHVSSGGGHIITDKHNVWIALAPYFYPIYSILLLVLYGALSLFIDLTPFHRWFLALLGATWGFHITFTLWMIPKGQTDLTYHGTFFSLVIIYLMNLLVLTCMLIIASPHVTMREFGSEFLRAISQAIAAVSERL